jgi:hypothetical protein
MFDFPSTVLVSLELRKANSTGDVQSAQESQEHKSFAPVSRWPVELLSVTFRVANSRSMTSS